MTPARPPLPADQWRLAIATLLEAWQVQQELCTEYRTCLGINSHGWFVASPGSGLSEKAHGCEEPPVRTPVTAEILYKMAA